MNLLDLELLSFGNIREDLPNNLCLGLKLKGSLMDSFHILCFQLNLDKNESL